jgi:hypothetical protein
MAHLLKHQFQPDQRSSGRRGSMVEHRRQIRYDLAESPSLRGHAAEVFAQAYRRSGAGRRRDRSADP